MHNAITAKWWGVELCLDEDNTSKMLTLVDSGGDAAGLLAIVDPEVKSKVALAVVVAVFKIGTKVVKSIDEAGGKAGVCISHPWIGPVPGWVTAQTA